MAPTLPVRTLLGRAVVTVMVVVAVWVLTSAVGVADTGSDGSDPRLTEVHVVRVSGTIDLGLSAYLERALRDVADSATGVLIEIDTPGGRLDAVIAMRAALVEAQVPTVAFVDGTAFSAGALVALASERIYMTPSGVIGAATPVLGGTGETADAKTISAVRGLFKATAETRGRDPLIAAAMVDVAVEIPGVVGAGELLTLTAAEALEVGYADAILTDRAAVLASMGWEGLRVREVGQRPAETLVRLITGTVVSSLLLVIGLVLLIGDVITEGFGLLGVLGLLILGLFFWGHLLAGLAGWEDVVLVGLGIALIMLEVLVLPGVGVAGVAGLAAIGVGAFLAITGRNWDLVPSEELWRSGVRVAVALTLVTIALLGVLVRVGRHGAPGWLTLTSTADGADHGEPREDTD